ncbi:YHS domain-containing protein [Algibacter amylolyticus]|uniref:YHS domain-containing protein n=1 Tax=Algibacter amylolyticus TaxID=1608400 RepID=A0A5M7BF00_9FLAO|nr:YHS domain-containing (seleno)protein [Algibacter amylolyticus]KAA5827919.1 YHS domain-containing protein [Algibacter amylolyticus]MBB5267152.1 YHS domain-containing protein [Algibacter amylolyticus]TSJ82164.1 YHS domain-containing protein [Algibacter amylolyticus]
MKSLIALLILSMTTATAQSIDYNLKKGFIAHGYDVVAYFNNKAVEGDKTFTTSFDGAKYKFSSAENLNTFKKHPEKYIPEYGGYCAYAIGAKNDKVSINPKTFQIKDNKLYLFYNAWGTNTLELWKQENETILKEKADKNWQNIKFKKYFFNRVSS